jgi:hypothetical protein
MSAATVLEVKAVVFFRSGEEQIQAVAGRGSFCCQRTAILLSHDEFIMNILFNQTYTLSKQYVLRRNLRHSATSLIKMWAALFLPGLFGYL